MVQTVGLISIHAPREGGDKPEIVATLLEQRISIHAPREGGDHLLAFMVFMWYYISIHAPREGGDCHSM